VARLDSRWLQSIPVEDKENLERAIRTSGLVLGRLRSILDEEYEKIERSEEVESQFENPNWSFLMAYKMGQRAELKRILALLQFLKE